MFCSYAFRIFGVAITLLSFSSTLQSVKAQTTYTFNATYDVSSTSIGITPNISATTISGESTDAPYGLTQVGGLTYSQVDFITGSLRFNTNPVTFGLGSLPIGEVALFGSGSNRLVGTNNATGAIDLQTLTATATNVFTIASGEGLFENATGALTLNEVFQVSLDPTVPTTGRARVSGTIQVPSTQKVPEPTTTTALIGMGAMGVGLLLRQQRHQGAPR